MKKIILLTTIGAMVTFGAARLSAQSTNTNVVTTITNVVQTVNISLTGFEQTGGSNSAAVSTFRIATRDVIRDLGTATGTSFSSRARLTAVTPLGGGPTTFAVTDVGTNNTTDVSSILAGTLVATPVARARTNSRGRTTGTQWSIQSFTYGASSTDTNAPSTSFDFAVQGFTTTQLANGAFTSSVNGTGTRSNGDPLVLRGTISGGAGKLVEVTQ